MPDTLLLYNINLFYMNKILFLFLLLAFFPFSCSHLGMAIEYEIMDRFWHSRCLNNSIDIPNIMGSSAGGATASLVAKNLNKKNFSDITIFDHDFVLSRGRNWL